MAPDGAGASAIAGVVDRPRLYRILDSPLVRACVVQGPSGCGKTTLLRSWALQNAHDRVVTWVSLESGATGRHAFWRQVAASARRLGDLADAAAVRVDEQLNAAADPARIVVGLLAGAGPVTLVLDAYEHLGDARPEVDADLARLVTALPNLRVLVTTRDRTALTELDPPGGVVRVITLAELALTPDEVGALIAIQTGIEDERLARSVAGATKGFALTVRSVVLALAQLGRIPRLHSMEWDEVVASRLESRLPDPVPAQFVTDTSVSPFVDAELATRLSGQADAAQLLDTLERNGFGRWIPYGRHHPVFQYVETIRDTFRARARGDEARFRRSCTITAGWLLEGDETDQALIAAIDGGDYALADRIFVRLVISDPDSYITDRFLAALRAVPDAELRAHPMLAFGLGLALSANPILHRDAARAFQIAIDSTARPAYIEPSVDAFSLEAMRAVARREVSAFRESAHAALEAVRSAEALGPELLARYGDHVGTILRQLSYSLLQGGRIEEATSTARRSVALCTSQTSRNYSIVYAAGASAFAGDVGRARAFLSSIDTDAWPVELRRSYLNGMGVVAECFSCLDALDFAGAAGVLQDTDCFTSTTEFWPYLTAISVSVRHGLGQASAEAQRVSRELAGSTPPGIGDNVATEHLHAALARAWIAAGDHRAAGRLLDGQPQDSPHLAGAHLSRLLADERDREALALAHVLLELPDHTLRSRADTWTTAAVAALRQDRTELAWSWLDSAAVAWETYGPRMHVATLPARDRRRLWELGLERGSASVQRYLEVPVVRGQTSAPAVAALTPREHVVLRALAEHGSIREIAQDLVVSPHTIKTQLQGLYRKLGVSSRASALVAAAAQGLVDPEPRAAAPAAGERRQGDAGPA